MNAFLIDIDTLKKIGFTNSNVENNIISTTLRRVQDTMLLPILGTEFFKRLLAGVDDNDLSAEETTLLNEYIAPCLIAGVDLRIVNHLTYEIRNKTVGTTRDEHINPVSIPEKNQLTNDLRADYEVYRERLIGYLKDNCTTFPTYNTYVCEYENIQPDKGDTYVNVRFA